MAEIERGRILDAVKILDDLMNDLVAGTMVFRDYQSRFTDGRFTQEGIVAVQRLCVSHLILALNKLCEFWEVFNLLVPPERRAEFKALVIEVQKRGVREFRNSVVAHVRDRKGGRTPTHSEAMSMLDKVSAGSPSAFLLWLNNPADPDHPTSVAGIVQDLRDHLRELHRVTESELFGR